MEKLDLEDVCRAKHLLENPGLAMKVANLVGKPVELGLKMLPKRAKGIVVSASKAAMEKTLDVSLLTMSKRSRPEPSNWLHRLAVGVTGAVGGAAGWIGLPVELPISTALMFRSIADQARFQGEDLSALEARLNCLMVFALGGTSTADDDVEEGYFAIRAALSRLVAEAAEYVAGRAAAEVAKDEAAPAIAKLVARLAARYAPQVADKAAAELVPVVGALGGATVNLLFMNHFQDMAWAHFSVRRLERQYGEQVVREAYERCNGKQ